VMARTFQRLCILAERAGVDVDVDAHSALVTASGPAVHVRAWVDAAERLGALHRRRNEGPES
jgi:hypothetical protein